MWRVTDFISTTENNLRKENDEHAGIKYQTIKGDESYLRWVENVFRVCFCRLQHKYNIKFFILTLRYEYNFYKLMFKNFLKLNEND